MDSANSGRTFTKLAFQGIIIIIISYIGLTVLLELINSELHFFNNQNILQGLEQLLFFLLPAFLLLKYQFAKTASLSVSTIFRIKKVSSYKIYIYTIIALMAIELFTLGYLNIQKALVPHQWLGYYIQLEDSMLNDYSLVIGSTGYFMFFITIITGALTPAVSEELVFRGFFQKFLEKENSFKLSIIITSTVFTMLHLNLIGIIPLFVLSLFLGYLAYISQSVYPSILAHFINNLFVVVSFFGESPKSITGGGFDDIPLYYSLLFAAIGAVITIFCLIKITDISKIYADTNNQHQFEG